jgi:hypothetical protein
VQVSDFYTTVTWVDLGCPTEPRTVEFNGMMLSVNQRPIDVADGDPYATFAVTRFVSLDQTRNKLGVRTD